MAKHKRKQNPIRTTVHIDCNMQRAKHDENSLFYWKNDVIPNKSLLSQIVTTRANYHIIDTSTIMEQIMFTKIYLIFNTTQ